jgi:hypothetical protein
MAASSMLTPNMMNIMEQGADFGISRLYATGRRNTIQVEVQFAVEWGQ